MNLDNFIKKYDGQGIDWDGSYGYQCMDLAHCYAVNVVGKDIPAVPAAKDEWNKTIDGYTKIANTPDGVPLKGDIIVWGTEIGAYGHIAVFIEGNVSSFTSFDQNFPINSLCHKQSHNYKGVLGWFHPKNVLSDGSGDATELVKTKDLQQLRYREEVLNDVCNFLKFDIGTIESSKIMSAFENLKSEISSLIKSQAVVEGQRDAFRKERDKALQNACPDLSAHSGSKTGVGSTDGSGPISNVQLNYSDSGSSLSGTKASAKVLWTRIIGFIFHLFKKS